MAKRSKYGSEYSPTAEDDPREDGPDAPDATTTEVERPVGSEGFTVVEPGTVIDGIYYPQSEVEPGQEMIAWLLPEQAQALVDNGVVLAKDGVHLEKTPPEPPAEGEAEGEEIVA